VDRRATEAIGIGVTAVALFLLGFIVAFALFRTSPEAVATPVTPLASTGDAGVTATTTAAATETVSPTSIPASATVPSSDQSLEVKVGQLIMAGFRGQAVGPEIDELIKTYHLGNVWLTGRNIGRPEDVLALTKSLQEQALAANGTGMLISVDQEGGRVRRLSPPFVQFPAAQEIGCIGSADLAKVAAQVTGDEMRAVGINVNLAPVADVVGEPANQVIGDRSFGTSAKEVAKIVAAYVDGLHESHVAATLKHFAGHGSTSVDTHDSGATVGKTFDELEQTELPPFRAGIHEAAEPADLVMMAHVGYTALDPSGLPASLSKLTVEFLRRDVRLGGVGFGGIVVTDDLSGMGAIQNEWTAAEAGVMALQAGVDLLLLSSPEDVAPLEAAIVTAVHDGALSQARIDESLQRIQALKLRLASHTPSPLTDVGNVDHRNVVAFIAESALKSGCIR